MFNQSLDQFLFKKQIIIIIIQRLVETVTLVLYNTCGIKMSCIELPSQLYCQTGPRFLRDQILYKICKNIAGGHCVK
jgi:hypothetical protein